MPFWHGDQAGQPLEFGRRIGALVRELQEMPRGAAIGKLTREHDLDPCGCGESATLPRRPGACDSSSAGRSQHRH